ncbi:MAG: acyl-CoA reductase, partial [Phaeodactylibacter sp.]|nr:acyl-CoA reductase [Phaeodactylibacter sp.]
MQLKERIEVLVRLGEFLQQPNEYLEAIQHRTYHQNNWFTTENQQLAIQALVRAFLQREKLEQWLQQYPEVPEPETPKRIGLIPAGNIPLVGFHDLLCIFVSGHKAVMRPSEKEKFLTPYLLKALSDLDDRCADYFAVVPQLKEVDAVIATGSDNSARYFESYFGKYPHIIRKNRNAVAVLTGAESPAELLALGTDVFRYFGLGCRNVAKLYVPQGYDFEPLLETLHEYREIVLHNKYKNNFDYNYAMLMINKIPFLANGCIILREDPSLT